MRNEVNAVILNNDKYKIMSLITLRCTMCREITVKELI